MAITSPCINICQINPASRLCMGCFRSLPEIAAWGGASDAHKREILAAVAQRRRQAAAAGGDEITWQEVA